LQQTEFCTILLYMTEITKESPISDSLSPAQEKEIEEMLKAGVHLGHSKSKKHPAMQPYIFGVRNSVLIIDLTKTKEKLAQAQEFIRKSVSSGGQILLVGTRPAAKKVILETAEKTGMPYQADRWIGGTLTNFKAIAKRVEYMENLEKEKATGGFEKYTKREILKKTEEIGKLQKKFNGIRNLKKLPAAIFVVDITQDEIAVKEARKMNVPVVALADTNSDYNMINWPVPSNDDALPAVTLMAGKITESILEGIQEQASVPAEGPKEPEQKKEE